MSKTDQAGSFKTSVRLDQLFLAMDNPRHEEVGGEPEAIEKLCGTEDIDALARDIAHHGVNPAERLILYPVDESEMPGENTSYFVAEGNRRVCAMKLLKDPDLAPAGIRQSISTSSKVWTAPESLDAVVIRDKNRRNHWLQRIHDGVQGGRGRKPWDSEQKTRFFGGSRNVLAQMLMDYAEKRGIITREERKGRISHLSRLLSNELVKNALGIDVTTSVNDLMRNRPEEDFDNILRALLEEARTKTLGSQVRKEAINQYVRNTLAKLDSVSGRRIDPETVASVISQPNASLTGDEAAEPEMRAKPLRRKEATHIKRNDEIVKLLESVGANKLSSLYHSICVLNVGVHTPMVSIAVWAFFECLSASIGRSDGNAFKDFYAKNKLERLGVGSGRELTAPIEAIKRIADFGNITKHHKISANYNAPQLVNDMDTLGPVIVASLKEVVANG